MKIYLIRHGQSTSDLENRYGGDYDDPLTDLGRSQAKEMIKKLSDSKIEIIFTSPKLRAKETAETLQKSLNCKLEIISELRERNRYAVLTGLTKREALEKYPDLVADLGKKEDTIEGAETWEHFKQRVLDAFNNLISSSHEKMAIVSHGGPIKLIVAEIKGKWVDRDLDDCEIIELVKQVEKNGGLKVVKMSS